MPAIGARPQLPLAPLAVPALDANRPRSCLCCGWVADTGLEQLFNGDGTRIVSVVAPPAPGCEVARLIKVVARRFRCKACDATVLIYPPGVMSRFLFSLVAIVTAWWHSVPAPLGGGLTEDAVYARQGVDRFPAGAEANRTGRRRWRSLSRWAARIDDWWPGRAVAGRTWRERITSLLAGFLAEADIEGEEGVVARAVAAHATSEVVI